MHSHEEDTASERVFHPVTYKFPRSRGRIGYEFKSNGECTITGFGPTDRSQKSGCKCELDITDHIKIIVITPAIKYNTYCHSSESRNPGVH
jgi:hypothetical protein